MPSRITCPSCQKKLQVGSKYFGKKINCPVCKVGFIAQPDSDRKASSDSDDMVILVDSAATEPRLTPPVNAPLVSPVASSYTRPGSNPVSQPVYHADYSPTPLTPTPTSRYQQLTPSAAYVKPSRPEETTDDGLPSFVKYGAFLMFIGVMSLVLPMFGLQFRRLQGFGENAWLFGMFLALIGCVVVVVGYLMRSRWDLAIGFGVVPAVVFIGLTVVVLVFKSSGLATSIAADSGANSSSPVSGLRGPSRGLGQSQPIDANQIRQGRTNFTGPSTQAPSATLPATAGSKSSTSSIVERPMGFDEPEATETGFENSRPRGRPSAVSSSAANKPVVNGFGTNARDATTPSRASPRSANSLGESISDFHEIVKRQMEMNSAARDAFGMSFSQDFPLEYVSNRVGDLDRSFADLYLHAVRSPMIGLDSVMEADGEGLWTMIPVFDPSENHTVLAKDGYAISGLNVHFADKLLGIQPIFMKLRGKSLIASDSYTGEWIGAEPSQGSQVTLGNDGRTVIGICINVSSQVDGLALILDSKK